jgi:ribokinase
MTNIIVLGSLNMDLVVKVERMPRPGETVSGGELRTIPGGKGANQAVAAAKLGGRVAMVGRVGGDAFGSVLMDALEGHGVDTSLVGRDGDSSTGTAVILVDAEGENRIVISAAANGKVSAEDVDRAEPLMEQAAFLILQFETPLATVDYALQRAAHHPVRVILNPAPCQPVSDAFLSRVDCLVLNETETQILTDMQVTDLDTAERAAQMLVARGVPHVILTLGERGALLATEDRVDYVPADSVSVVDTTAAGDAFVGGLAVACTQGFPLLEAVRYSTCAGTLAVTKLGAQTSLPSAEEVSKAYARRQTMGDHQETGWPAASNRPL